MIVLIRKTYRKAILYEGSDMKSSTKQQIIISTAKELFYKYGSGRVTVEEICRTAKVSKVTYYKYFANKRKLIEVIRDEILETVFGEFDRITEMELSYPDKIQLMTQWKLDFFSRMNNEFIAELFSLDDVVEEARLRYIRNIEIAQSRGEIRDDLSSGFIWMITEKLNDIIRDGSWKNEFSDYRDFQKQMRTLVFFGMLTRVENDSGEGED